MATMKRWVCAVGVVLLLAISSMGGAAMAGERIKVSYMFWGSSEYLEREQVYKDAFEAENPDIEIELLHTPSGYGEKLRLLMAAGTALDTYALDHQDAMEFILNGWALDLTPHARSTPSFRVNEVLPPVRAIFQFQGKEYGFANGASANMYFFNSQLFEEAGLEDPNSLYRRNAWTWDAFRQAARKMTRRDDAGRALTLGGCLHTSSTLPRGWIWANGGDEVDDVQQPTKALFDRPEAVQALAFIQDLLHRDQTVLTGGADFADSSLNGNATKAFSAGKLGMYARWVSGIAVHAHDPFVWGMIPYPMGPSPKGVPAADLTAAAYSVSPTTKHPAEAWRWVAFMAGNRGVILRMEAHGGLPSRRIIGPAEIKRYQPANFFNAEILFEALEYGRSRLMAPNQADILRAANAELNKIFRNEVAAEIGAAAATRAANAVITGPNR